MPKCEAGQPCVVGRASRIVRLAAAVSFAILALPAALAADGSAPPSLQRLTQTGYKVIRSFDAGHGLTGWVVAREGQFHVVYTTGDGQTLLIGNLFDSAGKDLTAAFTDQYVPHKDLVPIYDALSRATYVSEGHAKGASRVIYIIFDPNCPFCSVAWKALRPYVSGNVEIRWVPVAFLKPSSAGKVATILA